jgi:hypothetical protein
VLQKGNGKQFLAPHVTPIVLLFKCTIFCNCPLIFDPTHLPGPLVWHIRQVPLYYIFCRLNLQYKGILKPHSFYIQHWVLQHQCLGQVSAQPTVYSVLLLAKINGQLQNIVHLKSNTMGVTCGARNCLPFPFWST